MIEFFLVIILYWNNHSYTFKKMLWRSNCGRRFSINYTGNMQCHLVGGIHNYRSQIHIGLRSTLLGAHSNMIPSGAGVFTLFPSVNDIHTRADLPCVGSNIFKGNEWTVKKYTYDPSKVIAAFVSSSVVKMSLFAFLSVLTHCFTLIL